MLGHHVPTTDMDSLADLVHHKPSLTEARANSGGRTDNQTSSDLRR